MGNSNEILILKIKEMSVEIPKIIDQAGEMLVRDIRYNARKMLGNDNKYPFEAQGSFQKADVVAYQPAEQAVIINHPATQRIEYGMGSITIRAKNGRFLKFKGQDGEDVFREVVTIKPTKPTPFIRTAIKDTEKAIAKKFRGLMHD